MPRLLATELLTIEYFEAEPGEMPTNIFDQHHVLLNLKDEPTRVENWRAGEHRDFMFHKNEIVVTPAGVRTGWRWHEKSKVIVITLEPDKLQRFAQSEVGILLGDSQLKNLPLFRDPDICLAGVMLRDALISQDVGSEVLFESLARVFLVKLIQKYGNQTEEEMAFVQGFTSRHYKRVLDYVADHFSETITVENLANTAAFSSSHFSRLFKQTIGQSPMQFVMAYRVEQAKKKLARRNLSLMEIALECGFSDQAHFSRVFKQAEGIPPKIYRASLDKPQES
jgi:AraC family transcriptional regulator